MKNPPYPMRALTVLTVALGLAASGGDTHAAGGRKAKREQAVNDYRLAVSQVERGEPRLALPAIERAVEADRRNVDYRHLLGIVLFSLDQLERAREEMEHALRLDPTRSDIRNSLGSVFSEMGLSERAADHYRAAATDPAYVTPEKAWGNLGQLQLARGDHQGAIESFYKALEVRPTYCMAYFWLGQAQSETHVEQAIRSFERSLGCAVPEEYLIRFHLGLAHRSLTSYDAAAEQFERVVEIAPPGSEEGQRARALLGRGL